VAAADETASKLDLARGRLDFSSVPGLAAVYQVGSQSVVAESINRRPVRITARRDLSTGRYVSECERQTLVSSGGNTYLVWAHTTAYPPCSAGDADACIEAALLEVSRLHV
jgi:hypothetical protein